MYLRSSQCCELRNDSTEIYFYGASCVINKCVHLYRNKLFSEVQCHLPKAGIETNLTSAASTFRYLETATYTCTNTAAMVAQGNLTLTCEADGKWSDSPPVCGRNAIKIYLYWFPRNLNTI